MGHARTSFSRRLLVTEQPTKREFRWLLVPLVAALLIGLVTLGSGMRLDDYLHGTQIHATLDGRSPSPWWDIFFLADFDPGKRFSGAMPWWTADGLHIRFFRPLAAASHLLDYTLWPESRELMHAHSLAIHLLFVGLVTALYRRYFSATYAAVAAVVFAVSVNHASTVTWIANRNALLAGCFGVGSLLLFQDWCAGRRRGLLAAPLLLAGLLSAEASIGIFGLLLVLPLPRDEQNAQPSVWRRWGMLGVLVGLTLVWRALYSHYGFGALNSGAYVDPMRSPLLFVQMLPERLSTLGAMALAPLRLVLGRDLGLATRVVAGVGLALCGAGVLHAGLTRPCRRWLGAAVVAMLPLVASTPEERLLTIAFIGVCPAIASVILAGTRPRLVARTFAGVTAVAHLVVSPALFVYYAVHFQPSPPVGLQLQGTGARNLVLLSAPSVQDVTGLLESQFVHRLPRPAFTWYLWISEAPDIQREGCCALEISDPRGHGREPFSEFFRDPQRPLQAGAEIKTLGYDVSVLEVDEQGYVTKARFDFRTPLEHPNLVFADWRGEDFVNVDVPAP